MTVVPDAQDEGLVTFDCIDDFEKKIPSSKKLAEDATNFCKELRFIITKEIGDLEKENNELEEKNKSLERQLIDPEEIVRFIRDSILDREPDATLRKKLERFVDLALIDKAPLREISSRL